MTSISGTIIAFNEERKIGAAIRSMSCCDEVIVVDSNSTDRTRDIAVACGARVVLREWPGYSAQKNYAASIARHDWILSVDADERLSVELSEAILQWKRAGTDAGQPAWSMPRRAFYLNRWIGHSGWYPDRKPRLYDRRRCRWTGTVHERLEADGAVGQLNGDLLHFSYDSLADHLSRIDRYSALAATEAVRRGKRGSLLKLAAGPPLQVMKTFVFNAGFLDGRAGTAIAALAGYYVLLREFRILRSRWNGSPHSSSASSSAAS